MSAYFTHKFTALILASIYEMYSFVLSKQQSQYEVFKASIHQMYPQVQI